MSVNPFAPLAMCPRVFPVVPLGHQWQLLLFISRSLDCEDDYIFKVRSRSKHHDILALCKQAYRVHSKQCKWPHYTNNLHRRLPANHTQNHSFVNRQILSHTMTFISPWVRTINSYFLCDSLNYIILIMGNVMKKDSKPLHEELWNSLVGNSNQPAYLIQCSQKRCTHTESRQQQGKYWKLAWRR